MILVLQFSFYYFLLLFITIIAQVQIFEFYIQTNFKFILVVFFGFVFVLNFIEEKSLKSQYFFCYYFIFFGSSLLLQVTSFIKTIKEAVKWQPRNKKINSFFKAFQAKTKTCL